MLLAYLLASALTLSAMLGRSSGLQLKHLTYANEHKTTTQSEKTGQVMAVGDRSSNLKYVLAIQSSMIWEEIKKRSLTINTSQGLDDAVADKSPDHLTDQELAQLKQACHDGLKCVAVDQLLVLKQVKELLGDGKVSVRTAITKITQVLTQYTTEYHEDVYQYEAVQQSDDQSKVYESVTTIVEDNKELCQIDLTPTTEQSRPINGDGNTIPAAVDNKNNTVNYNTIKNYNINNGTINSATINIEPHSDDSVDGDRSKHETPPVNSNAATDIPIEIESENRSPDHRDDPRSATDGPTDHKSTTNVADNDARHKRARSSHAQDSGTAGRRVTGTDNQPEYEPRITDDARKPTARPRITTNRWPSPRDVIDHGSDTDDQNSGPGRKYRRTRPDGTGPRNSANTDEPAANNEIVSSNASNRTLVDNGDAADGVNNNTVQLDNSSGCKDGGGENDSDSDIVSAGSYNNNSSRKGLVEDGFLNNGNMKVKSVDNSNRNKGTVKGARANNGIINVGTTNNGPVNYGTSKAYTNNGTTLDMDNHDIRQYVNNIDKMYSTILNEFAKN